MSDDPETPAPGALAALEAFINTGEYEPSRTGADAECVETLPSAESLARWFGERGLSAGQALTQAEFRWALEVREALRDSLREGASAEARAAAIETLNRAARGAQLQLVFDEQGSAGLRPLASGVDAALGRLLAIAAGAIATGTWARMRACGNDDCRWVFFDHSKNRSANWCGTKCCNLMKARAYRRRKKDAAAVGI